jgi:hypothetical protein
VALSGSTMEIVVGGQRTHLIMLHAAKIVADHCPVALPPGPGVLTAQAMG